MNRLLRVLPWVLVAVPALYQLVLLATAIAGRIGYPYDLEWMEGGMLHHALRIQDGEGIYGPPSVDFIPYLYTPLYPATVALLGNAFGIGYKLGRSISVLALGGIALVTAAHLLARRHRHPALGPALGGYLLALGLFAAAYPFVEGWYDLVRADTMFLFMITAGLAGLTRWSVRGTGLGGHARVAAGGVLLALAFFCKQTGILYVALGGLVVLVLAWRRVPAFVLAAGVVGLGGVAMLDRASDGWFWIYISKIHRAHDFHMPRFWSSFKAILWHFPPVIVVVVAGLVCVAVTAWRRRSVPSQAGPLLLWSAAYAVSTVVGAIGFGTQFAHPNAYMPALLHGALAAGSAIPAVYGCIYAPGQRARVLGAAGAAGVLALALAWTCWDQRWKPARFTPTVKDVQAGKRLVTRLSALEGDVWMPSHPWYLQLAGKLPHVHRMGIKDVTTGARYEIEGLIPALERYAFSAIVLDNGDLHNRPGELDALRRYYRAGLELPANERPRVFSGAPVQPHVIWIPALPARPPQGARAVFDFETATWDGWQRSGPGWGNGPVTGALPGEGLVLGATGARYASSMHGGDKATGRMTSPPFVLDGSRLSLKLGGDTDAARLRVELWVAGKLAQSAGVPRPGGSTLRDLSLDVSPYRGETARLILVDDSETGRLQVDDVWLWQ